MTVYNNLTACSVLINPTTRPTSNYNSSNDLTFNASYTYDANGNTTAKTDSTGTTTYTWDYENRLTSVTLPGGGGTVSFKYDPFGRRIYKSSSSGTSIFAYDGDNLVEEANSLGAEVASYSQGLNIDEPLAMERSSATSFYDADGLGSITSLSSGAGALAQTYTFDSFGKVANSTGSLTSPFQYTARESDPETGLYYYRARYYDSTIGRFRSEDPARFPEGTNFYRYVQNHPTNLVDPSGLFVEILCERVQQWGLGILVRGDGARHCRVHVRCDKAGGKYDVTYELNGPGAGALRADLYDPSRPVDPQVPVTRPADGGCCDFENCISKRFSFFLTAATHGGNALPDYDPINQNSNAFGRDLVVSCGGKVSFPPYPWGFFGQMPD